MSWLFSQSNILNFDSSIPINCRTKNVSFALPQPGLYLIKGESGSGKTSLVNLLLNYFEPEKGAVTINGIKVRAIENLRDLICINRQESAILSDSLLHNLNLYQDIDTRKIYDSLKQTNLEKYANAEALDIQIKKTFNLSGGEEKRIAFIRSMLQDKQILILDEPFANLDPDSVDKVCKLITCIKDKYVILISHEFPEALAGSVIAEINL